MSSVNLKRKKSVNGEIAEMTMDHFDRFEFSFATHWKKLIWAAVVIVVLTAVICTVHAVIRNRRNQAITALGSASTRAELTAALEQYGSSPAATAARLRLAALCIADQDYDSALAALRAVDADAPEIFKFRALLNQGYVLELAGKPQDALTVYLNVTGAAAPAAFRAEAACAAARLQLAAKDADAARGTIAAARQFIADAGRQGGFTAELLLGWDQQLAFLQNHLPAAK